MQSRVFGRYETLMRLGRGGMAEVFAARMRGEGGFSKLVAIKRMLPHMASDEALVERFLHEARVAVHVPSAHVVQTLDVGRDEDGSPFIVLELVVGITLASLLERRPLPSPRVRVELLEQALRGLADVHAAVGADGRPLEIVHRDVSPQNILIGRDGRARIADFGIARANLPRRRTQTGLLLGKLGYLSPEQVRGDAIDARSDVFAMGVVAWEALTGRRLFRGVAPEEIADRLLRGAVASPRAYAQELPVSVCAVVERALAPERSERWPDGSAFGDALRAAARELGPAPGRAELVEEVRRVAGDDLRDLEQSLAELASGSDVSTETGALPVGTATVSGLLGIGWDPHAPTALLPEPEPTAIDGQPGPEGVGSDASGAVTTPMTQSTATLPRELGDAAPVARGGRGAEAEAVTRPRPAPRQAARWPRWVALALAAAAVGAALAFAVVAVMERGGGGDEGSGAAPMPAEPAAVGGSAPEPGGAEADDGPEAGAERAPSEPAAEPPSREPGAAPRPDPQTDLEEPGVAPPGPAGASGRPRRPAASATRPPAATEPEPRPVRPGQLLGSDRFEP